MEGHQKTRMWLSGGGKTYRIYFSFSGARLDGPGRTPMNRIRIRDLRQLNFI